MRLAGTLNLNSVNPVLACNKCKDIQGVEYGMCCCFVVVVFSGTEVGLHRLMSKVMRLVYVPYDSSSLSVDVFHSTLFVTDAVCSLLCCRDQIVDVRREVKLIVGGVL